MTRDLDAAAITEIDADHVRPVMFAELDFDSGTLYLHDGIGTYTWGGHDWQGVGDFGGVDLIEEGEQASPFAVRLRLSGIDTTIATEALGEDYYLRDVNLYIGFLDSSNDLVATPDVIWSGQMDVMDLTAGEESTIFVTCESYLARLDRVNGKLFTEAEQQSVYATDTFFKYLPNMQDLRLVWAQARAGSLGNDRSIFGRTGGVYIPRPWLLF